MIAQKSETYLPSTDGFKLSIRTSHTLPSWGFLSRNCLRWDWLRGDTGTTYSGLSRQQISVERSCIPICHIQLLSKKSRDCGYWKIQTSALFEPDRGFSW